MYSVPRHMLIKKILKEKLKKSVILHYKLQHLLDGRKVFGSLEDTIVITTEVHMWQIFPF